MAALHYYTAWALGSVGLIISHIDYLPSTGLGAYTNTPDFLLRIEANSLPILSSYPIWTGLWWITRLEIISYLSRSIRSEVCTSVSVHVIQLFVIMLWLSRLSDPLLSTSTFSINGLRDRHEEPNLLLLSPINKIHPVLLYLSTAPLWYILTLQSESLSPGRYTSNWLNNWRVSITWYYSYMIAFTVMLGGYWAAQEGSWGSWWNWDPSEEAGLILMLVYLVDAHVVNRKRWFRELCVLGWWRLSAFALTGFVISMVFEATNHNFSSEGGLRVWEGSRSLLVAGLAYTYLIEYQSRVLRTSLNKLAIKSNHWSPLSRTRILQTLLPLSIVALFCTTTLPLLQSTGTSDAGVTSWLGCALLLDLPYPSLALVLGRLYFISQPTNLTALLTIGWSNLWLVSPSLTYPLTAFTSTSIIHFIPVSACINVISNHACESYNWYFQGSQSSSLYHGKLCTPNWAYLEASQVILRSRTTVTLVNYSAYDSGYTYYQAKQGLRKSLLPSFLYSSRGQGLGHQIVDGSYSGARCRSVMLTCGDYGLVASASLSYLLVTTLAALRSRAWMY